MGNNIININSGIITENDQGNGNGHVQKINVQHAYSYVDVTVSVMEIEDLLYLRYNTREFD